MAGKRSLIKRRRSILLLARIVSLRRSRRPLGQPAAAGAKNKNRVQRSYFIDRDLDKALRKMALEEEKKLTEAVNEILRMGLQKYL